MWFTARVVDAAQLRDAAPDAVVRPLAWVAERPCARPGCPASARATLTFRYATREAWLARLTDEPSPQAYDLCVAHASRTQPPHGWELRDRRPEEDRQPDVPPATPADLGGDRTVAVLAAALRQVPDAIPAHGDRDRAAEVGRPLDGPQEPVTERLDVRSRDVLGTDTPAGPDPVPRPRGVIAPPAPAGAWPQDSGPPAATAPSEDEPSPVLGHDHAPAASGPRPILAARRGDAPDAARAASSPPRDGISVREADPRPAGGRGPTTRREHAADW